MSEAVATQPLLPPSERPLAAPTSWDFWLTAPLVAGAEIWLGQEVLENRITWPTAIYIHLGIMATQALWTWLMRRRSTLPNLLLLVMAAPTGAFGAVGAVLAALMHAIFRRYARPFEEWYRELFPTEEQKQSEMLYKRLIAGRHEDGATTSLISFTDILRLGTREQKEAVIALLTRNFRPAFAPALRLALADETPSIRVQAATAASEIESKFLDQVIKLTKAAEADPDDFKAQLALARFYDDYSYSGLLDADREAENRRLTLKYYLACLDLNPDDLSVRTAIGRSLVRSGDTNEAVVFLRHCLNDGYANRALVGWYVEGLFKLRHYDEVAQQIARYEDLLTGTHEAAAKLVADPMPDAVHLWLDPDRVSA